MKNFMSKLFVFLSFLIFSKVALAARVRLPVNNLEWWEVVLAIFGIVLAGFAISIPAKSIGKYLFNRGLDEGKKWKVDLGSAVYKYSFYLTFCFIAVVVIAFNSILEEWPSISRSGKIDASVSVEKANSPAVNRSDPASVSEISRRTDSSGGARIATYANARAGFKFIYPGDILFPKGESENGDGQVFVSRDGNFVATIWLERREAKETRDDLYRDDLKRLLTLPHGFSLTYNRRKDSWFVISGVSGAEGVYRRVHVGGEFVVRLESRWKFSEMERWRSVIEQMKIVY